MKNSLIEAQPSCQKVKSPLKKTFALFRSSLFGVFLCLLHQYTCRRDPVHVLLSMPTGTTRDSAWWSMTRWSYGATNAIMHADRNPTSFQHLVGQ